MDTATFVARKDDLARKYDSSNEIPYARPDIFEKVIFYMSLMANAAGQGSSKVPIPVIIGTSGVGKTRTAREAGKEFIARTGKGLFIRIDMNDIPPFMTEVSNRVGDEIVLASMLCYQLTGQYLPMSAVPSLEPVLEKIREELGFTFLVVNIDEYQFDLRRSQRFVTYLVRNNKMPRNLPCVPIVSGIPTVLTDAGLDLAASWVPQDLRLTPVFELETSRE